MKEVKKYNSLDGLRTIACLGIIMIHMLANNKAYYVSGFIFSRFIPSFADFIFLFMVLSAFGMCCGYYQKILSNNIDLTDFYKKRYMKVLPFFSCLVMLDLFTSFSKGAVYEAIADMTLTFGLFPNAIKVIGVGWFLGLIFVFYMIFPFYCVLIGNKKRAWCFFVISLILNFICAEYFKLNGTNIVFSFCYFMLGGLLFLYKDSLEKMKWQISLGLLIVSIAIYYFVGTKTITCLSVLAMLVIFALGEGGSILDNAFTRFISGISLEMYLSHMVIYRVIEKLHLNTRFGTGVLQYTITCILVIGIDIVFAYVAQRVLSIFANGIKNYGMMTQGDGVSGP